MPLSDEQMGKLKAWFVQKGVNTQCPACGHDQWTARDVIAGPVIIDGGFAIGSPTMPMVQVICDDCAYVRLFAAGPIGLLS